MLPHPEFVMEPNKITHVQRPFHLLTKFDRFVNVTTPPGDFPVHEFSTCEIRPTWNAIASYSIKKLDDYIVDVFQLKDRRLVVALHKFIYICDTNTKIPNKCIWKHTEESNELEEITDVVQLNESQIACVTFEGWVHIVRTNGSNHIAHHCDESAEDHYLIPLPNNRLLISTFDNIFIWKYSDTELIKEKQFNFRFDKILLLQDGRLAYLNSPSSYETGKYPCIGTLNIVDIETGHRTQRFEFNDDILMTRCGLCSLLQLSNGNIVCARECFRQFYIYTELTIWPSPDLVDSALSQTVPLFRRRYGERDDQRTQILSLHQLPDERLAIEENSGSLENRHTWISFYKIVEVTDGKKTTTTLIKTNEFKLQKNNIDCENFKGIYLKPKENADFDNEVMSYFAHLIPLKDLRNIVMSYL